LVYHKDHKGTKVTKIFFFATEDAELGECTEQARIERTEREFDALVYRLYGLSEDEVRIVEKGG